ncbi:MAG: prephenate dehydrogenase, partial [Chloroflexi bacterium]|nr:prephenate dehydrogenase [Chloroflexota bacterium]
PSWSSKSRPLLRPLTGAWCRYLPQAPFCEASMDDGFFLPQAKIAIIGLGLMGGSLALALKGKCAAIYGIDPDSATRELALRQNIVDMADADPAQLLPLADLVILAAPVPAILTLLEALPDFTPNPCIVLDLGSPRFDPLGGHPICGKEKLSLENAERTLYYAAPFLLTPLPRTTAHARAAVDQIIEAIGARATVLAPAAHDRILASTSHLPFLLSSALVLATPPDVAAFIGPGFRSASRLAGTPSSMMLGVVQSNRENLLPALEALQDELSLLIDALARNDTETLSVTFNAAREKYQELISPR